MTYDTNALERTTRRIVMLGVPLLVTATGTAAAHGGGGYGGGMMGGGWGLFGGGMGLWGLLWMGLLIAVPFFLARSLLDRASREEETRAPSVLRERYARGEITDEEFEHRRERLERSE
ncbi:SHOCT domain-containing protein [Halorubrum aquaticum]|nr:SHOCT domain-containing protein [Halorubrum aquaticum]